MANLGGHCLETILEAFGAVDHEGPVVFIAYTVKGWGTPLAGHKDNHAGIMTPAQMEVFRKGMGIAPGREWDAFTGLTIPPSELTAFLREVPFNAAGTRRLYDDHIPATALDPLDERAISTQAAFGKLLESLGRGTSELAARILTCSPDVTVSTNLGPWVNRRDLFAPVTLSDTFREERVPSAQKWRFSPQGQHIELGIAEMNLFLLLAAAGLSHSLFGKRLIPIGTLYDPFIARGLDALNYACYQDARFLLVASPSGITLAPEGGAHQSIGTPLIGLAQDGLAAFEPAFADELAAIMDWSFDYLQRGGEGDADERTWLRDETGGSVYLRLSTKPLEQPRRALDPALRQGVIDGAYWLREPGPNCDVVIAYQGCLADEAIAAAGMIGELRRDVGVLAVTSADRLNAGWHAAQRARLRGRKGARAQIERLFANLPPHAALITVIDGHPATLAWLGAVMGHRTAALGVEHFGQSGSSPDLYRHYGIDARAIAEAAARLIPGRPLAPALRPL
jgi:pyruvate dehydrogenase E1 component